MSSAFTHVVVKSQNMATKRVLTVAEVVEKLQDSGSKDEIGEDGESEDDFDTSHCLWMSACCST